MATDSHNEHDVVRVYSGPVVSIELYQQALKEVGIESKVVGLDLSSSFGSAMANSVELWVKGEDADRSIAAIRQFEAENGEKV